MIRRPPPSPLFPYTTLFRSRHGRRARLHQHVELGQRVAHRRWAIAKRHPPGRDPRSEEHTSELQSLTNLVCRLLLEKKKKTQWRTHRQHKVKPEEKDRGNG